MINPDELSEEQFYCPITQKLMEDPVKAADGFTYERHAIEQWLSVGKPISPVTGEPLAHTELKPDTALLDLIKKHREKLSGIRHHPLMDQDDKNSQLNEKYVLYSYYGIKGLQGAFNVWKAYRYVTPAHAVKTALSLAAVPAASLMAKVTGVKEIEVGANYLCEGVALVVDPANYIVGKVLNKVSEKFTDGVLDVANVENAAVRKAFHLVVSEGSNYASSKLVSGAKEGLRDIEEMGVDTIDNDDMTYHPEGPSREEQYIDKKVQDLKKDWGDKWGDNNNFDEASAKAYFKKELNPDYLISRKMRKRAYLSSDENQRKTYMARARKLDQKVNEAYYNDLRSAKGEMAPKVSDPKISRKFLNGLSTSSKKKEEKDKKKTEKPSLREKIADVAFDLLLKTHKKVLEYFNKKREQIQKQQKEINAKKAKLKEELKQYQEYCEQILNRERNKNVNPNHEANIKEKNKGILSEEELCDTAVNELKAQIDRAEKENDKLEQEYRELQQELTFFTLVIQKQKEAFTGVMDQIGKGQINYTLVDSDKEIVDYFTKEVLSHVKNKQQNPTEDLECKIRTVMATILPYLKTCINCPDLNLNTIVALVCDDLIDGLTICSQNPHHKC